MGSDSDRIRSSTICRSAGGRRLAQLALERPGQSQGLGAAGSVGKLAEERVDRRQRGRGIVDGGQREGLRLDGLPALVVTDLLLGRFDLADRGGQLRRLVLELTEPGVQVGRGGAVGDLDVGRLDLPFGLLQSGLAGQAPARTSGSEGCHSSSSDHRRATAGAAAVAGALKGRTRGRRPRRSDPARTPSARSPAATPRITQPPRAASAPAS